MTRRHRVKTSIAPTEPVPVEASRCSPGQEVGFDADPVIVLIGTNTSPDRMMRSPAEVLLGTEAGATIRAMAKDENSNGASPNGDQPYLGLSDSERAEQQQSLQEYADELRAEGADGSRYLPKLEALAATWPE